MTVLAYFETDTPMTGIPGTGRDIEDLPAVTVDTTAGGATVELHEPCLWIDGAVGAVAEAALLLYDETPAGLIRAGYRSLTSLGGPTGNPPRGGKAGITVTEEIVVGGVHTRRGRVQKNGGVALNRGLAAPFGGFSPAYLKVTSHDPVDAPGLFVSTRAGRMTPGVKDVIIRPRRVRAGRPLVIYGHGGGNAATEAISDPDYGLPTVFPMLCRIALELDVVVAADSTTLLWGSPAANARDDDLVEHCRTWHGATGPVGQIGLSAGTLKGLSRALYGDRPAWQVGIIPCVDLDAAFAQPGMATSMRAAYGVAAGYPIPDDYNPWERAQSLTGFPQQFWYAGNDPFSEHVAEYGTIVDAEVYDVGPHGHSPTTVALANVDQIIGFARDAFAAV